MKWLDKLMGKNREPFVPATESQGNYIIMMYRDLQEWRFDDKATNERCEVAFQKMHKMVSPYINTDDYYDRSVWTLSKAKATEILTAMEPEFKFLQDQE